MKAGTSNRPRVAVIVGTRPEAIKVAPVVLAARARGRHEGLDTVVVATGQHPDLVDRALLPFGVEVDVRLSIPDRARGSQATMIAALLPELERTLNEIAPDAVLVQGDTVSVFAGAMAGHLLRIPVVHLEAGLRSGDTDNPFPEETYRTLVADLASLHLAPTPRATRNLLDEGVWPSSIVQTGNTVVDAAHLASASMPEPMIAPDRRLVVVTVHRRENWGEPLRNVMAAIRTIVDRVDDIEVVVPAHPNPAVRTVVEAELAGLDRVRVTDPMDHAVLIAHLRDAALVLSDSGGVQEEAPAFGTPVLVLRETTERPEAVDAGCAEIVGTGAIRIAARACALLLDERDRAEMARPVSPFGDGRAAIRSIDAIRWMLGCGDRPMAWSPAIGRPDRSHLVVVP